MYLPKVIAFNAKDETAAKTFFYAVIADEMKLGGETTEEKIKLLIAYLRGMNDKLNIPQCIKKLRKEQLSDRAGLRSGRRIPGETARHRCKCHRRCLHRIQPETAIC